MSFHMIMVFSVIFFGCSIFVYLLYTKKKRNIKIKQQKATFTNKTLELIFYFWLLTLLVLFILVITFYILILAKLVIDGWTAYAYFVFGIVGYFSNVLFILIFNISINSIYIAYDEEQIYFIEDTVQINTIQGITDTKIHKLTYLNSGEYYKLRIITKVTFDFLQKI